MYAREVKVMWQWDIFAVFFKAFGVGAFEDDDEDIYATEDMSNYDFGEEKEAKDKKQGREEQQNLVRSTSIKFLTLLRHISSYYTSFNLYEEYKLFFCYLTFLSGYAGSCQSLRWIQVSQ